MAERDPHDLAWLLRYAIDHQDPVTGGPYIQSSELADAAAELESLAQSALDMEMALDGVFYALTESLGGHNPLTPEAQRKLAREVIEAVPDAPSERRQRMRTWLDEQCARSLKSELAITPPASDPQPPSAGKSPAVQPSGRAAGKGARS
jgi:hypothetical protein